LARPATRTILPRLRRLSVARQVEARHERLQDEVHRRGRNRLAEHRQRFDDAL
jgi:hypothetical protein